MGQQKANKINQKSLEKLQKKLQAEPLGDKLAAVVTNPKGAVKMSEVLEDFVKPYLKSARTRSQREKLFSIAIVAWNAAILPAEKRQSLIEEIVNKGIGEDDQLVKQDVREIIDELIARKQRLFADNQRYIVDFQLQDAGSHFNLSVASTLLVDQ